MPPFSQLHTPGGYVVGEVTSAMQKEIRRGNERDAFFWASELELGGWGAYVWKRLLIIASEDVGIADSSVAVLVRTMYENWLEMSRKVKNPAHAAFHRVFIAHAVVVLARAKKSRMLDHLLMVTYSEPRPKLKVPDYALDRHTARGRQMGRDYDHFFDTAALLENESETPDIYAEEGRARFQAMVARQRGRPSQDELFE